MSIKTKIYQAKRSEIIVHSIGSWVMGIATLLGISHTHIPKTSHGFAFAPAYVSVVPMHDVVRADSKSETVHMPTKFDVGLRVPGIARKK